jgi:hypothetical protein
MIIEGIIDAVISVILSLFPESSTVSFDFSALGSVVDFFRMVAYLLPMGTVSFVVTVIVALQVYRVAVSFFKTLWGVLPLL